MNAIELARGAHWVVYAKPAGMTVVSGRGVVRPTLLDVAIERFPQARPVHRLDKPTTGCCIIATSLFGQQSLSEAFRRRLTDKRYCAIVEGVPTWKTLNIDARLARVDDPDLPRIGGKKAPLAIQTIDEEKGIRALTRVKVLARGNGYALVECRPETGRMHQIRCHLAHVGFPIVGDSLYGATGSFTEEQDLALHGICLSFPQPEGGRAFVTAPTPNHWWTFAATNGVGLGELDVLRAGFAPKIAPPPKGNQKPSPSTSTSSKSKAGSPHPARGAPRGSPGGNASRGKPATTGKASVDGGRGRRGSATPPTSKSPKSPTSPAGQPRSKRGGGGARSGPSRRGGPPGR